MNLALLYMATVVVAAAQGPMLPATGPAAFDIAGVRLGMTPSEARAVLEKAGYRVGAPARLEDFRGEVAAKAAQMQRRTRVAIYNAVASIEARASSADRIGVEFGQWPDGPRAVRIVFTGNPQTQSLDAFRSEVERRFGKPTLRAFSVWRWCSQGDVRCGPGTNPDLPTLDADYQARTLIIVAGVQSAEARKVLVEAEAAKLAPLQNGGAF